jgi:hypothetical protein
MRPPTPHPQTSVTDSACSSTNQPRPRLHWTPRMRSAHYRSGCAPANASKQRTTPPLRRLPQDRCSRGSNYSTNPAQPPAQRRVVQDTKRAEYWPTAKQALTMSFACNSTISNRGPSWFQCRQATTASTGRQHNRRATGSVARSIRGGRGCIGRRCSSLPPQLIG